VTNTFDIPGIKEKIQSRFIENYGVDHISKISKLDVVKEKQSKTSKNKTILEYAERSIKLLKIDSNRVMTICCDLCDRNYEINYTTYMIRLKSKVDICIYCNKLNDMKSSHLERKISSIVSDLGIEYVSNFKISNRELDVYVPSLKVGFEFNGLYWHCDIFKDKNYHIEKTKLFMNNGISLFHIWEDDWIYKQDIVKSMIINKLGKTPNKIYARKCIIKEISDNKLVKEFLNKNHIQGFFGSKIKLGLFYNNELVSLMTFGNLRKSLGQKSSEESYELLRFCNKLNTNIVGGASKLFKFFCENYKFKEIISYSDNSRGHGNLYKKLGFSLIHETDPNYYWIVGGRRIHRFNFRKDKLVKEGYDESKTEVQIMTERGYYRIFDCGNQKWIFKQNNNIIYNDYAD